jgi:hypothetical protein
MLTIIIGIALKIAGALLGFASKSADQALEYQRIKQGTDIATIRANVELAASARDLQKTAMQYKVFWVAWSLAALPMAAWFGWGMLDTLTNGWLPDVAAIPAGLKPWAQAVWDNVFYTGAAAAGVQGVATTIANAIKSRR